MKFKFWCQFFETSPTVNSGLKPSKMILCIKRNKLFQCKIRDCSVWKSSEKDLRQHIRDDHPDRKHFCDVCPMAFKEKYNLDEHLKVHSGVKPFMCEQCGKRFTRSSDLTNHKRIHTGERPFKCEVCGMAFKQAGALKRHLKRHKP